MAMQLRLHAPVLQNTSSAHAMSNFTKLKKVPMSLCNPYCQDLHTAEQTHACWASNSKDVRRSNVSSKGPTSALHVFFAWDKRCESAMQMLLLKNKKAKGNMRQQGERASSKGLTYASRSHAARNYWSIYLRINKTLGI